jgi:hypothetical protein
MKGTQQPAARIRTRHPQGKSGVSIARDKYDAMRRALLDVIPRRTEGVAFSALPRLVRARLDPTVYPAGTSVPWYLVTVKQDLEARGLIEQVPDARPQRVRRIRRPAE